MRAVDKDTGLTQERLKSLLSYDPDSGVLRWKVWRPNGVKVGDAAGTVASNGYLKIQIDGHKYQASRLIWFYVKGEWPTDMVDHENQDKLDNRWVNLREANASQNGANRGGLGALSGLKGAHYAPRNKHKKWAASIRVNGRARTIGYFHTPQEAHEAYLKAADAEFGVFANGGDNSES
jgi:hypothetical protein